MKMKRIWKKVIARVLVAVMLVSVFSTVDMGWNVRKVQAEDTVVKFYRSDMVNGREIYTIYDTVNSRTIDGTSISIKPIMPETPYGCGDESYLYYSNTNMYLTPTNLAGIEIRVSPPSGKTVSKVTVKPYNITGEFELSGSGPWILETTDHGCHFKFDNDNSDNAINQVSVYLHSHQGGSATCQAQAKCSSCGQFYGSKADHKYNSQTANTTYLKSKATCTAAAQYYYKCAWCTAKGTTYYNSGSALGHEYTQYITSDKTITVKCKRFGSDGCTQSATYKLVPNSCTGKIEYVNRENYTSAEVTASIPSGAPPKPKVMYQGTKRDGSTYGPTETKPTDTGTYEAYIAMNDGNTKVFSSFSIAPGGDIYKFDKGDTSATGTMSDQLVLKEGFREGTKLNKNQFQKIGYAFEKWLSSIPGEEFIDEAVVSEPNLDNPKTRTLTAQWKANDYTVTFDNNGADKSQGIQSETVTYDETLPLIETSDLPEKNCSDFLGYFTDKTSGVKVYDADGKPAITNWTTPNNTTLYAHWNINHNWGYEAKDNQVIATCQNEGCGFSQRMTLDAPDSEYNKSAYNKASVTNDDEFPQEKNTSNIEYEGTAESGDVYDKSSTAPKDAGAYKATVTVADNGSNYVAKKEFTIDKATQSASASVEDYEWGSTLPSPSASGVEESATPTFYYNTEDSTTDGTPWNDLTSETLDVGTYYVYAELSDTANYKSGKTATGEFKVKGLRIDSSIIKIKSPGDGGGVEYDKKPHTADIKVEVKDEGDNPDNYKITYATSPEGPFIEEKPTFTDAGEHKIYYKVKRFGYEITSGDVVVKINPIEITIISGVKANNKEYDGKNDANFDCAEVSFDKDIIEGDTLTVTANGTFEDENVGEGKAVTINTMELGGASKNNYKLAASGHQNSATADISPREVTLEWTNLTFNFDNTAHVSTATAGNLVDGDSCDVTVKVNNEDGVINAGTYTAEATELSNSNYKLPAAVTQSFTINKIDQPTVIVTMQGFDYSDTSVPTPSVSDTAKETPAVKYYYSLENKKTGGKEWKDVTPQSIEPDTYYMYAVLEETTNYKAYTTGTVSFKVNGDDFASTDITAEGKTTEYNGVEEHGITVTVPPAATVMYGTSAGSYTLTESPKYKNVGTYTVYYRVTKTGYNPKTGSAVVTISAAPLTVTPDSGQTKVYGDADPAFTYTVSGLLGSDTASVVTGTLKRASGENVTSEGYELSKNDDMTADNYDITCTSGVKFKITPRDLTADMITLTKKKFESTGSTIDVSAGGNIVVKYKDVVRTVGTDYVITGGNTESEIGTYYVTIEGRGNFKGSVDKEWKITNEIVPGVSAIDFEVTYDGNSHTIVINGAEAEDIITYGISEDAIDQESVSFIYAGTHTVWCKVARGVYEPFEASATVTINPKEISVTWGSTSLVYNGMTQAPQATASGLIGSDVCEVIVAGLDAKNVGSYTATATGVSNVNYKLPDTKPTTGFVIIPKPITVTGKNASKYVNKADPVLTYVAQSVCAGDVLSGVIVTRDAGESVGSYPIRVTVDDSLNPNYAITTQNGTFTIKNPEPKEEPRDDGNSGNNTTPVVNAPIVKPNIQLPETLVPVVNKAETTTNTKAKEAESEPVSDEGVDFNAGKLTLHVEVLEESPIKKAEVSNQVGELLDNSDIFTLEEAAAIKNGENARVWVSVDKMDMSKISSDEQKQLTEVAKSIEGDDVKLLYFDINMFKQIGSSEIFAIREPGTLIKVSIELPEYAINLDEHMEREYKVLRLHDGEITVLDTEYDPATRMLTFATDKFSTYVFAYVDKPVDEENAENAASTDEISVSKVADDASSLNVWLFIIPVIIIAGIICAVIIYRKKREDDMMV